MRTYLEALTLQQNILAKELGGPIVINTMSTAKRDTNVTITDAMDREEYEQTIDRNQTDFESSTQYGEKRVAGSDNACPTWLTALMAPGRSPYTRLMMMILSSRLRTRSSPLT